MQSWYGLKVVGSTEQANVPEAEGKVAAIPRLAIPEFSVPSLVARALEMGPVKVEEAADGLNVSADLKHLSSWSVEG